MSKLEFSPVANVGRRLFAGKGFRKLNWLNYSENDYIVRDVLIKEETKLGLCDIGSDLDKSIWLRSFLINLKRIGLNIPDFSIISSNESGDLQFYMVVDMIEGLSLPASYIKLVRYNFIKNLIRRNIHIPTFIDSLKETVTVLEAYLEENKRCGTIYLSDIFKLEQYKVSTKDSKVYLVDLDVWLNYPESDTYNIFIEENTRELPWIKEFIESLEAEMEV